ncbi:MAG: hypothetical protein IJS56_01470 [Bacilli bacterium]|nr:hypothetical protein [Bacilli bacterium]
MDAHFDSNNLKEFLKTNKPIGKGYFGSCYLYNNDYVLKAMVEESKKKSNRVIYKEIKEDKKLEEYYFKTYDTNYTTKEERLKETMERLSYTKYSYDLIQGLAYYYNYCFGTVLKYYKDYLTLAHSSIYNLSQEELDELYHNIEVSYEDLFNNYIYPLDIRDENIMFNNNLEVKLIDLDDGLTFYNYNKSEKKEEICRNKLKEIRKDLKR